MSADEYDNARWAGIAALVSAAPDGTDVGVIRRIVEQELSAGRQVGTHNRADLVLRARRESYAPQRGQRLDEEPRLRPRREPSTEDLALRVRQAVRHYGTRVSEARQVAFGQREHPFDTLAEAVDWLQTRPEQLPDQPAIDEPWRAAQQAVEALRQANEWAGTSRIEGEARFIYYWTLEGAIPMGMCYFRKDDVAMNAIWQVSTDVSAATGIPAASVVVWVLTGAAPGERVTLKGRRTAIVPGLQRIEEIVSLGTHRVMVTFDRRDLTARGFETVRRGIVDRLARTQAAQRALRAPQQRVVEAVETHGGPPTPKYQRAFWQNVLKSLPKSLRRDDWRAVARQYYRAVAVALLQS